MASLKIMLTSIIIIIIGLVVVMNVAGETVDDINTAGNSIAPETQCGTNSCFWNSSRTIDCTANNVTSGDTTGCAIQDAPLGGLFATNGIVTLLFMAGLLILIVGTVFLIGKAK